MKKRTIHQIEYKHSLEQLKIVEIYNGKRLKAGFSKENGVIYPYMTNKLPKF